MAINSLIVRCVDGSKFVNDPFFNTLLAFVIVSQIR